MYVKTMVAEKKNIKFYPPQQNVWNTKLFKLQLLPFVPRSSFTCAPPTHLSPTTSNIPTPNSPPLFAAGQLLLPLISIYCYGKGGCGCKGLSYKLFTPFSSLAVNSLFRGFIGLSKEAKSFR